MKYIKHEKQIFIKFDKGEELVSSFLSFLETNNITAGTFTAIGAIENPVLGYFNTETKSYDKKEFKGDYELVSLQGNIGLTDAKISTHIHVSIADNNLNTFGGHLFSTKIAVTCEMFINIFPKDIDRIYDPETKLNLLSPKG